MTAFKYFKSLRKKHSHEETLSPDENLTAEETPLEFSAHQNQEVAEHAAFVPGFKLTPMDEEIGPSEAVQDLPEVVELTEAADNLSASHPPVEAELDHTEIPQTNEAELEPVHEPAVTVADSQELAELSQKLKSLIEEKDSLFDRLLRKQAEFENFRKRTEKEKQEFYDFALSGFVQTLLPVLDGLERSLSAQEGETVESYRKGNELILKQFRDQLWLAGTQPIRSMGKIFDPNYHQAVMREESSILAENEIIEEYQRGYLFKDRLLRPSMVKVAVAPPAAQTENTEESPAADETAT